MNLWASTGRRAGLRRRPYVGGKRRRLGDLAVGEEREGLGGVGGEGFGEGGLELGALADFHARRQPAEAGEGVEEATEVGGGGFDGLEQGLGLVDFGYVGVGELFDLAHAVGGVFDALQGALHEHRAPRAAVAPRFGVGDAQADQRVAAAEVVVKERERRADGEAVEPEGDLGQFDGERVLVDAVNAALEYEAADDGLVGQLGLVHHPAGLVGALQDVGANGGHAVQQGRVVGVVAVQPVGDGGGEFDQVGDVVGEEVDGADEEVAAAHGGVQHLEIEHGLGGVQPG